MFWNLHHSILVFGVQFVGQTVYYCQTTFCMQWSSVLVEGFLPIFSLVLQKGIWSVYSFLWSPDYFSTWQQMCSLFCSLCGDVGFLVVASSVATCKERWEMDKTMQYCGLASRSGGVLFWVTGFPVLSIQKSYFILSLIYFWHTRLKSPVIQWYVFFGKCLVSVSSSSASVTVCNCHVLLSSSIMLYAMLLLFSLCGTVTPHYLNNVIFPNGKWCRKICSTGLHNFFKNLGVT